MSKFKSSSEELSAYDKWFEGLLAAGLAYTKAQNLVVIEGRRARQSGLGLCYNPYNSGTENHKLWLEGYSS